MPFFDICQDNESFIYQKKYLTDIKACKVYTYS